MTFIDWSDREEMIGLLVEYVADEKSESAGDRQRMRFLDGLAQQLRAVADSVSSASADRTIAMLRRIVDSQNGDFAGDEVWTHVHACIEELERIRSDSA